MNVTPIVLPDKCCQRPGHVARSGYIPLIENKPTLLERGRSQTATHWITHAVTIRTKLRELPGGFAVDKGRESVATCESF